MLPMRYNWLLFYCSVFRHLKFVRKLAELLAWNMTGPLLTQTISSQFNEYHLGLSHALYFCIFKYSFSLNLHLTN